MLKVNECMCVFVLSCVQVSTNCMLVYCAPGLYSSESGESRGEVSPPELGSAHTHTHRGGSTVARGGQNPAAFSYLWPIKSHVIWWLTLMGNGWNPSLSSSLIVSTLNGATVKIRWCHHVRSPLVATVQHLTLSTYTVCGFLKKRKSDFVISNRFLLQVRWKLWGMFESFFEGYFYSAGSFQHMSCGFNDHGQTEW